MIRDWTERNFDFTGYVTGFDPADLGERTKLRAELGYGDDERVCIVTVGGSGVGADLLRRVIAAFPQAKERVPELRMIVVAGPRIDPESLPSHPGLEVVPYVHNLYRHLAACDLAVVQGGLTTSMELTAQKRPFLVLPAAPPLRAELPRPPPARTLWGRSPHGLRRLPAGADRGGDRRGDRPRGRLPRRGGRRRRQGGPAPRRAALEHIALASATGKPCL